MPNFLNAELPKIHVTLLMQCHFEMHSANIIILATKIIGRQQVAHEAVLLKTVIHWFGDFHWPQLRWQLVTHSGIHQVVRRDYASYIIFESLDSIVSTVLWHQPQLIKGFSKFTLSPRCGISSSIENGFEGAS